MTTPVKTLSSKYYTDPGYYQVDKEKILYKTWQFVCHQCEIPQTGSFLTTEIGDESLVVIRDHDGEVRAFYNVCRHRAHRIASGKGKCNKLVCPYHAWTYHLDGTLAAARGINDSPGFDLSKIKLTPVRVEKFCGFIFVNLDDGGEPLDTLYPGLKQEILDVKPTLPDMVMACEDQIVHECNWKVSVENFSECYHCPVAHQFITTNLYSGTEYRIWIENNVVKHYSPRLKEQDIHGDLFIWFLWPNLSIQLQPLYKSISVRQFVAKGPRESVYIYRWYADNDLSRNQFEEVVEMGSSTYHETNGLEDQNIVKNVQLGLESRSYNTGVLVIPENVSAESEHAVAYFQKQYLDAIS